MALNEDRARKIVTEVERQHKAFHSLQCAEAYGIVNVQFAWFDRPAITAVREWFMGAGALVLYVGRDMVNDCGVIVFREAA